MKDKPSGSKNLIYLTKIKLKMIRLIALFIIINLSFAFSQDKKKADEKPRVDKFLPKGNEAFKKKKYAEAEKNYRLSNGQAPNVAKSAYNLGNSAYRQQAPSESKNYFSKALQNAKTKEEKHYAFHNMGNVMMNEKNYQGAVDAYKNALKNNPKDEETRYNYALAKKLLKDNPPPPDDKNQDNKDQNQDKKDQKDKQDQGDNKDNKDKGDDKDKKDNKDKGDNEDKGDKGDNKDDQKPQPQGGGADKQRAEQLLKAVENEEKRTQDKVNAEKAKGTPIRTKKDW